jgi:zinc protease
VFLAGQGLVLRDDHPDYPSLVLGNFLLGGGFLDSRTGEGSSSTPPSRSA